MGGNTSHLKPEVMTDLKNTTAFTQSEISDIYRQYMHDTSDHVSMKMDLEDFKKIYREVFPRGDADRFAEHVFKTFDKDDDGHINFREFISKLSIQLKGTPQQKLEWLFDLYDIDNAGSISRDEVLEMTRSLYNLHMGVMPKEDQITPIQLTDYVFERSDKGKDNKITRIEFLQAALSSKTVQALLEGTATAASSPYLRRKNESGSFGRPRTHSGSAGLSPKHSPKVDKKHHN